MRIALLTLFVCALLLPIAGCGGDSKEDFKKDSDKKLSDMEKQIKDLKAKAGLTDVAAKATLEAAQKSCESTRELVSQLEKADEAKYKDLKPDIEKALKQLEEQVDKVKKDLG